VIDVLARRGYGIPMIGQWGTNKIRQVRKSQRMSSAALAKKIGVSDAQVRRLEVGERRLTVDMLRKIGQALDVPSEALIGGAFGSGTLASAQDEVEPATINPRTDVSSLLWALEVRGVEIYRARGKSVELAGIAPNELVFVIKLHDAAPKNLDVVLVRVLSENGTPVTLLRQFVPPDKLITNQAAGRNSMISFGDPELRPEIIGIVLRKQPEAVVPDAEKKPGSTEQTDESIKRFSALDL
jgi:transcriptional regulator with XRE-family HTH domain